MKGWSKRDSRSLRVTRQRDERADGGSEDREGRVHKATKKMRCDTVWSGWGKGEVKDRERERWMYRQMSGRGEERMNVNERREWQMRWGEEWEWRRGRAAEGERWSDGSDRVSGRRTEGETDRAEGTAEGQGRARERCDGGMRGDGEKDAVKSAEDRQMKRRAWGRNEGWDGWVGRKRAWIRERRRRGLWYLSVSHWPSLQIASY